MINYNTIDIHRGVMHTIVAKQKGAEEKHATVKFDPTIFNIDDGIKAVIRQRLLNAAAKNAKAFELEIGNFSTGSFFDLAKGIKDLTDDGFFETSKKIATLLAESQESNNITSGVFILLDCTFKTTNKGLYVVIKAEPHDAMTKKLVAGKTRVEVLKDIFLSPSQKLYKVGIIHERTNIEKTFPNNDFTCFLFDEQFSIEKNLSQYFHDKFLGFSTDSNAKILIRNYYNRASSFIIENIPDSTLKGSLIDSLNTELKSEAKTFAPAEFGNKYIQDDNLKALYKQKVSDGLPSTIQKETDLIKNKLTHKTMFFDKSVKLTGNLEDFDDSVTIIDNIRDFEKLNYKDSTYTIVKIKGKPFGHV